MIGWALVAVGWSCFGGAALLVVLGEIHRRRTQRLLDRLAAEIGDCHATIAYQHRLVCSLSRALHGEQFGQAEDGFRASN